MLRFLRQFRQHQLAKPGTSSGGGLSRYLLYALGEIVLVVAGILIALQINNWNEERILRKKEITYLGEIRVNLQEDLRNLRFAMAFNAKKDSAISNSLNAMLQARTELGVNRVITGNVMRAITGNMPVLTEYSVFTQNRVAFDNMLSAENIDLISRDSLRTMLSSYYSNEDLLDGTQGRIKEVTRNFADFGTSVLMTRENISQFFGVESSFPKGEDLDLKTLQSIFGKLFLMQRVTEAQMSFLQDYEEGIELLIKEIDEHLANTQ